MNWNICIMERINKTLYTCSESMYSRYINVDPEQISMWYWTMIWIKINALYLETPIWIVWCKFFPCTRTVTFLDTCSNERMDDICSTREGFYWYEVRKKVNIFVLIILYKWIFFPELALRDFKRLYNILVGQRICGEWNSRQETTARIWSNLDQIPSKPVLW